MRIAILASHVIQYQAPLYQRLAADPRVDLTVLYCSRAGLDTYRDKEMGATLSWDLPLLESYRATFLRNYPVAFSDFLRHINPGVIATIDQERYDAVLFMLGWGSLTSWLAALACRASGTPMFMYGDSSFVPEATSLRGRVRDAALRALFAITDAFLISGAWNADYYTHYGVDRQRFFPMPWAIDNDRFRSEADMPTATRSMLRAHHGIPDEATVFLYSGKLIPRKDPLILVEALARLKHRANAHVLFLGDGELRDAIEARARARDVADRVHIAGFVNQARIPQLYGISDVFVLPSHYDPRATVVNEAMAAGLPVIITDQCGPAGDLVEHGVNGFIIRPSDEAALASALEEILVDGPLRRQMGAASLAAISTWNYETGIEGLVAAAQRFGRHQ